MKDETLAKNESVTFVYRKPDKFYLFYRTTTGRTTFTGFQARPDWTDEQLHDGKVIMAQAAIDNGAIEADVRAIIPGDW